MSQHVVPINAQTEALVGWDQPMLTFFAQVYKIDAEGERVPAEDGGTILWVGTTREELYEIEDLMRALRGHVRLTHELQVKLYGDRDDGK